MSAESKPTRSWLGLGYEVVKALGLAATAALAIVATLNGGEAKDEAHKVKAVQEQTLGGLGGLERDLFAAVHELRGKVSMLEVLVLRQKAELSGRTMAQTGGPLGAVANMVGRMLPSQEPPMDIDDAPCDDAPPPRWPEYDGLEDEDEEPVGPSGGEWEVELRPRFQQFQE